MFDGDYHKESLQKLNKIIQLLEAQYDLLNVPKTLNIEWTGADMSTGTVALNLTPTAKAVGVVTELNADGSVFKFDPNKIVASVQDVSIATVAVDSTSGDITVTPVAVGSTQVAVKDTATNNVSPNYTVTVTASTTAPGSLSVAFTITP